jgi:hypothetical protein
MDSQQLKGPEVATISFGNFISFSNGGVVYMFQQSLSLVLGSIRQLKKGESQLEFLLTQRVGCAGSFGNWAVLSNLDKLMENRL